MSKSRTLQFLEVQGGEHVVDQSGQETNTYLQSPRSPALVGLLHGQQLVQTIKPGQALDRAVQVKSKSAAFRHLPEDRDLQCWREKTDICTIITSYKHWFLSL